VRTKERKRGKESRKGKEGGGEFWAISNKEDVYEKRGVLTEEGKKKGWK
jgi:hypothetical protein